MRTILLFLCLAVSSPALQLDHTVRNEPVIIDYGRAIRHRGWFWSPYVWPWCKVLLP